MWSANSILSVISPKYSTNCNLGPNVSYKLWTSPVEVPSTLVVFKISELISSLFSFSSLVVDKILPSVKEIFDVGENNSCIIE